MLKFKCDRCGKEIVRDEVWNITMVPEAYAAEETRRKLKAEMKVQGELCGDCAEIILREMIYLKEVPARDCHGAERLAMTEEEVPARDCHGAERLAMTEGEVPARDCTRKGYAASVALVTRERMRNNGAERIAMTEPGVPKRAADSRPYEEKAIGARTEGRYIMIARKRAGMTIDELAKKLYICGGTLKTWENGRKKKLPWDEIEPVLPEVKEIREKGCEAFCPSPKACLGGGKCYYSGKRG